MDDDVRITTPPGERILSEVVIDGVVIRHLPDDRVAVRVSVGTPHSRDFKIGGVHGAYCVYRGTREAALAVLRRAAAALEKAT